MHSWAMFEVANGYPISSKRETLRAKINSAHEADGFQLILGNCIKDTLMTVARMLDRQRGRSGSSDRASLPRIQAFLNQDGMADRLAATARDWTPGIGEDTNERLTRQCVARLQQRLSDRKNGPRNTGAVRRAVEDLRNKSLAHALLGEPADLPRLFQVRDGVVLCTVAVCDASFAIAGHGWDAKDDWRAAVSTARIFWDRYEKGFS